MVVLVTFLNAACQPFHTNTSPCASIAEAAPCKGVATPSMTVNIRSSVVAFHTPRAASKQRCASPGAGASSCFFGGAAGRTFGAAAAPPARCHSMVLPPLSHWMVLDVMEVARQPLRTMEQSLKATGKELPAWWKLHTPASTLQDMPSELVHSPSRRAKSFASTMRSHCIVFVPFCHWTDASEMEATSQPLRWSLPSLDSACAIFTVLLVKKVQSPSRTEQTKPSLVFQMPFRDWRRGARLPPATWAWCASSCMRA
mmetsp:Transcript_93526/g.269313  ORF Transcript_93526/g.269313 Transcript_93526/m.269313 type:complete len:256 (-) Transcript_93526:101-868(-)